jgi:iron complex outermembrane receptor protein
MRKTHFCWLLTLLLTQPALAQIRLSGRVLDAQNQQLLTGATLQLQGQFGGTATDRQGQFSLKLPAAGSYVLEVRYLGYATRQLPLQLSSDTSFDIRLEPAVKLTEEIIVRASRASRQTPMAQSLLNEEEIAKQNQGQDLPYLLQLLPSVVVTSDAGAGVGYTGIRVRGSDPTRINVTINGIPVNDAESHGVFWVNMPDFASSVNSIQLQRGVGSSTNGAGAFGASLNLQTNEQSDTAFARIGLGTGSFNTQRQQVSFGSGRLENGWNFDGRLSRITSAGYIDRASSHLRSYGLSASRAGKKSLTRFNVFSGVQQTYQAWNGLLRDSLATNRRYNSAGKYTDVDGQTRFYDNETDNYEQHHFQFFHHYDLSSHWKLNTTLFYTRGKGYFEQYREGDRLSNYQIEPVILTNDTITRSDLIRRRWLDNHFYGSLLNATYTRKGLEAVIGGGWNRYEGGHFGEVIWSRFAGNSQIRQRYYDNIAFKNDLNVYAKANYNVGRGLSLFADLQYRNVRYQFLGIDNEGDDLTQQVVYHFFNPKAGINYQINAHQSVFASVAVGNREPVRDDFTESPPNTQPKHESLIDYEAGWEWQKNRQKLTVNAFYMDYQNQLVLTGQLNDVGAYIRKNVASSYRAGLEISYALAISKTLSWSANLSLSDNRIRRYDEYIDRYDDQFEFVGNELFAQRSNTPLALSPAIVGASMLSYRLIPGMEIALQNKYVGEQYVDNSGDANRKLPAYFLSDLRLDYQLTVKNWFKAVRISAMVNNLFDLRYAANGYVYPYFFGTAQVDEVYVYPQAGRHYLLNLYLNF